MFKKAILKAAQSLMEERKKQNLVAAISPVPDELIQQVLSSPILDLTSRDVVVDIGSGDGRWLIAAASPPYNAMTIGLELSSERLQVAQTLISLSLQKNRNLKIELIQCDCLTKSSSDNSSNGSNSSNSSSSSSDNNNNTTINNTSFDLKHATVIIFYLSREEK